MQSKFIFSIDKLKFIGYNTKLFRDVAKMVKAQDFDSCIREFESRHPCQQKSLFCLPTKETFLNDVFLSERDVPFGVMFAYGE